MQEKRKMSSVNSPRGSSKRGRSEEPGAGGAALHYAFDRPAAEHPEPPVPVHARLKAQGVGKSMIEGAVLALRGHDEAQLREATAGEVCTLCFVGRVDQKAGLPPALQKLIYLLQMVQDHYRARKPGGDVRESSRAGAHCVVANSCPYHRILSQGEVCTLPLFRVHLFVDEAVTSLRGERPMTGMYVFCVVEVPQTFDLLGVIQEACGASKHARGPPRDELRALWVDVMNHHLWFGGEGDMRLQTAFSGTFADLFDVNSAGFLPAWATPANCVRLARLHMMMEAMVYLEDAQGISAKDAAGMVVVRFRHIDAGGAEHYDPNRYDQTWARLARASTVNFYMAQQQHLASLLAHSRKPRERGAGGYGDIMPEDEGVPAFAAPVVLGLPTSIEGEDARRFVTNLCAAPALARQDDVVDFIEAHADALAMRGLPGSMLAHKVELGMLWPRQGGACQGFKAWLQHNNDVALPSASALRILMTVHQGGSQESALYASFLDNDCTLDPALRTVEDYRQSLQQSAPSANCMIYSRAEGFYRAQMRSLAFEKSAQKRARAWSLYMLTVAQPLARTYAAADSGRFGGRDPRINVYFRLGDLRNHRAGVACQLASVFCDGYAAMQGEMGGDARWQLGQHQGTLLEALVGMNAAFAWRNSFMCLKKNNLELLFRLVISGLSFKLCHNKCVIPQAPNHIGTTNWVLDFMGRVLVDHKDGKLQGTQIKTWGCGVDKVEAEFELAEHPKTYAGVAGAENLDEFPEMRDTRNSSELGLQKTHSVSGAQEQLRQVPDRYFCTEIKSNLGANAPGRTEYGKFCDMMARQTRSGAAPSRTTCVKDALGNVVPITEYGAAYMELMLASSNQETRRDCVHTFAAVVTRCFSGAMDTVGAAEGGAAARAPGAVDMGVSSKFTNQPMDDAVHNGSGWLFLAAMAVAQVVASQQMRGLLAVPPTIMDRAVMETLYEIIAHPAHIAYIAPESGCVSQWSREKEKVESVMPALGLLAHATNAFLKHRTRPDVVAPMKFSEFVHDCTVNWLAAPVPREILPELHLRLLNGTVDWCFWLLLGIFIDVFKVPAVNVDALEAFFDGSAATLPDDDARKITAWLHERGEPLPAHAANGPSAVRRSGLYVTTPVPDDGAGDGASLLTCNVASTQRAEEVPELRRACDRLAARLYGRYHARLKNSCNIHNAAALSIMLLRYANTSMAKDRFGAVCASGQRGWESWHALYAACGKQMPYPQIISGHASEVVQEVEASGTHLYAAPAIVCEQHEGQIWRFGVEARFLLWAAAIFGGANPISQPTLQRVPVHWTARAFKHRIPAGVYPYRSFFASVPSVEQDGLTLGALGDPSTRPRTMTRSLPRSAVEEHNPRMLQAVVDGRLPEDYFIVESTERLARIVRCEHQDALDYQKIDLPELTAPALPENVWVYFVLHEDDAAFPAAARLDGDTGLVSCRASTIPLDEHGAVPDGRVAVRECGIPARTLAATLGLGRRASLRPVFRRPGVAIQHEMGMGVLVPWEAEQGGDYFCKDIMAYRVEVHGEFYEACPATVERALLPVGSELLLRLDADGVADALKAAGGARTSLRSADRHHRKLKEGSVPDGTVPVLPVMLLYELPVAQEMVLGRGGVWVGARRRARGAESNAYHALFLSVATEMLAPSTCEMLRFEIVSG